MRDAMDAGASAEGGLRFRPAAADSGAGAAALKKELIERGVRFLLPSYADMHGASKAKMVPISHFDRMMGGSELFTGAALDGVPQEVNEEEVAAHPDPDSCMILPWQPDIAWFASNLRCRGAPFEACSRNILDRVRARAAGMGYGMNLGTEIEFFVFREPANDGLATVSGKPHLNKPAYDVSSSSDRTYRCFGPASARRHHSSWRPIMYWSIASAASARARACPARRWPARSSRSFANGGNGLTLVIARS